MEKIGYISDTVCLEHFPGSTHPESPQRLMAIEKMLEKEQAAKYLSFYSPKPALHEHLTLCHSNDHVQKILDLKGQSVAIDADTYISERSVDAAIAAAGAAIKAVELVCNQQKHKRVFAAIRPPGHHATHDQAMGFCLFNNIALAAKYAQNKRYAERVLIIDWDVHHGNGTQDIFYDQDTVFYLSLHQSPLYPGSGFKEEQGKGAGVGYTCNIPLEAGTTDGVFLAALDNALKKIETHFVPDLVLISAGFDAHYLDPVGGMSLTGEGFAELTHRVNRFANAHCEGRIISMLEGGYSLEGLADGMHHHLYTLAGAE